MLIWSYWPGREGGAEKQCRKLVHALLKQGVDCEILTGWNSLFLRRIQNDGQTVIRRLGFLCPMISVAGWLCDGLYGLAGRFSGTLTDSAERGENFERRFKAFEFWFMLPFVWLGRLSFVCGIERYLARNRHGIHVIHVHEASWIAGLGAWLGDRFRVPVVCKDASYPSLEIIGYDVPFRRLWNRWRKSSAFIAMEPGIARRLKEMAIDEKQIFMIPNGVDIPAGAADVGKNSDVLYVGNFTQGSRRKAFDVLFEAWVKVQKKMPQVRMTVVGGGIFSHWQELLNRFGCLESVIFAGSTPNLDDYYRKAALLVLPSRLEGMSNVLLESQSWGVPAVVSDIPGNIAVVRHGLNGLVVPVGDSDMLCEGIVSLLVDKETRQRMGAAARTRMEQDFSFALVTEKLVGLYNQLSAITA